jgi:hypothetical protein
MGLQQAEPMAQLIDAAQRLRTVRAAYRRFLMLWALDNESPSSRRNSPRIRIRGIRQRSDLRQLRLFDDL